MQFFLLTKFTLSLGGLQYYFIFIAFFKFKFSYKYYRNDKSKI